MLQLMPCLSKLTPANLVPINLQDYEDKLIILNSYKVMPAYHSDSYSKCIIRIPQDNNEEITIYSYPHKGSIPLSDLVCLFKDGKLDDPDASRNEETVRLERDNIRE